MQQLGKVFQFVGLALLPLAMVMELTGGLGRDSGVSDMLVMLVFGAAIFYVGRIMEGYARG